MDLYCAIDLIDGQAVRLVRGEFDDRRNFGDPVGLVRRYAEGGARWLHVVDLDAARTGRPANRPTVLRVAEEARSAGLRVEAGGGVRNLDDARILLSNGVDRIVVGTAAQRDRDFLATVCDEYPARVAVGLDHRRGGSEVAVHGWGEGSGASLGDALDALTRLPLAAVVITSIERDGTLTGPDLRGFETALSLTEHAVVASGGVRSVDDLTSLSGLDVAGRRLSGVVVGMALVDGTLEVKEAMAACDACE